MMEARGSAMNVQPMVRSLAERRDGWRALAARVGVLALVLALGSLLLGASPAVAAPVSFAGPTNFAAGDEPISVAMGDFNGDSDPDLAVVNQTSQNVSVLLGGTGGGFGAPTNFAAGRVPVSVAVGDFNGDSDPDLAVTNVNSNNVSVLMGGEGSSFSGPTNFAADSLPNSVAVGDFNGDSDPDLAVTNFDSDNVSVLLGGAGGGFGAPTNFAVGDGPVSVAVGDFNGDSDPDLTVTNFNSDNVSVLLGGTGGGFGAPTNFAAGDQSNSVAAGDFNDDSDPDLAVASLSSDNVSVLLGGTGGGFGAPTNFAVGDQPNSVAVGDINGDSDPDLAVANRGSDNVSVLLGGTGGGFGAPTNFAAGDAPDSLAMGDFNGDSDPDLAAANRSSDNISVLLNNHAPVAAGDSYTTDEDSPLKVALPGVLSNDTDADGDTLSADVVSGPSHGNLTLNSNGSFDYTPAPNYNGSDSFTYRASDGGANSGTATVAITVTAVNDAPEAADDPSYTTEEDTKLTVAADGVLKNDTDADGDPLKAVKNSDPSHGTLTLNEDGSFVYEPEAEFNGSALFTYRATDGTSQSEMAGVTIAVTAVNDAPVAMSDAKSVPENTQLSFPSSDLTANDSEGFGDEGDQTLTVTAVSNPQHGTVVLAGDGEITFTPETDYNGKASFDYTVCDDGSPQKCSTETATVEVTVTPVNSKPLANDGAETMNEDGAPITVDFGALVSDTETSDANLAYTIVSGPADEQGRLTGTGPTRTFDPADNYNGTVEIVYTVTDRGDPDNCGEASEACAAAETSDEKTVTIEVNPVKDAPVADDQTLTTEEDTPKAVVLTATDADGDGLTYAVVSNPEHGTLSGSGSNLTYAPDKDYNGPDSFTYKASDGNGGTDTATVTITVTPVNDAPTVAVAGGGQCGPSGTTGTVNLTVGDVESAADALTLSVTSSNQSLVPNSSISSAGSGAGRTLTLSAQPKRSGTATITLTVSDGDKMSSIPITVKVGTDAKETLTGTTGADMIFGKNGNDTINALDGNDLICGGNGAGTMSGGSGDDTLDGANGNDILRGEAGKDALRGGQGDDTLTGGTEADSFSGGSGTDTATDFDAGGGDTGDGTIP